MKLGNLSAIKNLFEEDFVFTLSDCKPPCPQGECCVGGVCEPCSSSSSCEYGSWCGTDGSCQEGCKSEYDETQLPDEFGVIFSTFKSGQSCPSGFMRGLADPECPTDPSVICCIGTDCKMRKKSVAEASGYPIYKTSTECCCACPSPRPDYKPNPASINCLMIEFCPGKPTNTPTPIPTQTPTPETSATPEPSATPYPSATPELSPTPTATEDCQCGDCDNSNGDLPECCKAKCCCSSNGNTFTLPASHPFCQGVQCDCSQTNCENQAKQPNPSNNCLCECMENGATKVCQNANHELDANCDCKCPAKNCADPQTGGPGFTQNQDTCDCECKAPNIIGCAGFLENICAEPCPDAMGLPWVYTVSADSGKCECAENCEAGEQPCNNTCGCNAGTCIPACGGRPRQQSDCACCDANEELVNDKCKAKCNPDQLRDANGDCKTCAELDATKPDKCKNTCYAKCADHQARNAQCECVNVCRNDCYVAPNCAPAPGGADCKPWEYLTRGANGCDTCNSAPCPDGSDRDPQTGFCAGLGGPVGGGGGGGGGGDGGGGGSSTTSDCPANSIQQSDGLCYCDQGYTANQSQDGCNPTSSSSSSSSSQGFWQGRSIFD